MKHQLNRALVQSRVPIFQDHKFRQMVLNAVPVDMRRGDLDYTRETQPEYAQHIHRLEVAVGFSHYMASVLENHVINQKAHEVKQNFQVDLDFVQNIKRNTTEPSHHPEVVAALGNIRTILECPYGDRESEECPYLGSIPELSSGILNALIYRQLKLIEKDRQEPPVGGWPALQYGELESIIHPLITGWWGLVQCFMYNVSPSILSAESPTIMESEFIRKYIDGTRVSLSYGDPLGGAGRNLKLPDAYGKTRKEPWIFIEVDNFDESGTGIRMDPTPVKDHMPTFYEWAGV